MPLPTFLIIGAAKAGTTSLHFYLDQHPEIQMSQNKEPSYFSGPENGIPYPLARVERLTDYERLFDGRSPVRGEASPSYTNHPRRQGVPERIKQLVPNAKLIYLVRDPVQRTVSHYQDSYANGHERRSLEQALGDLSDPYLPYICHSRYTTQLQLYLRCFDERQILVVDHAELLAQRLKTLQRIFEFLQVQSSYDSPRFHEELYRSQERRVYPRWLWLLSERVLAPALRGLPAGVRATARRTAERGLPTLTTATLEDETRERLQELYHPEAVSLRSLTGQVFPSWSV